MFGRRRILLSSATALDPNVSAYIAAFGITDKTEIAATNTFILGLKAAALYTKFKRLQLFSPTSSAAALGDFITLTSMSLVNAPTFATTGFTTNGTDNYIATGFIPSAGLPSNADFMYSVYLRSATAGAAKYLMGANQSINARPTYFNGTTASFNWTPANLVCVATGNITSMAGLITGSSGSTVDCRLLKNGVEIIDPGVSGTKPRVTTEIFLMANNNNGVVTAGSQMAGEICFWCAATNFTTGEVLTFYNLLQTFQSTVIVGGRQV